MVWFDAGRMPESWGDDAGAVVDFPDVVGMADVVAALSDSSSRRAELGEVARRRVVERHRVSVAVPRLWPDLERWAGPGS